jgi:hypothetical protein
MSVVTNQVEELTRLNEQLVAELSDTKESLKNQMSLVILREEQLCDAIKNNKNLNEQLTDAKESLKNQMSLVILREEQLCNAIKTNLKHKL